jgi:TonB family protein
MKHFENILYLLLFILISCKSKSDNKIVMVSINENIEIADSGLIKKTEPDNYLIDNTANQDKGPVYMFCEKMPEFQGGETAFISYIRKHVNYPPNAVSDKIEGRVVMKFVVNASGEISDVQVLRRIRDDLDKECLRVFSGMPKWKPGLIAGKPVSVSYSIPVRFLLQKSDILNGIYILPSGTSSALKHTNIP